MSRFGVTSLSDLLGEGSTIIRPPLVQDVRRTLFDHACVGNVSVQALFPILVNSMTLADLGQTITHKELVVRRGEERSGDVDENADSRVRAECLAAIEDCSNQTRSQVPRKIGRDRNIGEAPNADTVGQSYRERSAGRRNEWVGGVQACPDYNGLKRQRHWTFK